MSKEFENPQDILNQLDGIKKVEHHPRDLQTNTQQGSKKKIDRKFKWDRNFKIKSHHHSFNRPMYERVLMVLVSALLAAIGFQIFANHAHLLPGGFNGLSLLVQRIARENHGVEIPFAALNISFNVIPAFIAYRSIGKKFVLLSILNVIALSFLMDIIPKVSLTDDIILNTVFGAFFAGVGYSFSLQANASSGGTDFISMTIANKYNRSVWHEMLVFNAIIICISGVLFGFEAALYSIIFQTITTSIVSKLHSRFQKKTVMIIAKEAEPLSTELMKITNHGITSFEGIGRYSGEKRILLYMVVSKDDVPSIKRYIDTLEDKVFMNVSSSEMLDGNFRLRPLD